MFRTITRYRNRLAGVWSGAGGVEPAPRQRPAIGLRERALKLAYWSENGIPRDSLIDRLVKLFTRAAMPVRVDSGWNDYDLEIHPDSWTRVRVKTADEEHEGGKYKTVVKAQVRLSALSRVLLGLSVVAVAAAGLAPATASIKLTLTGLMVVLASIAVTEAIESGRIAYRAIEQCAAELGLIPLGIPQAAAPEPKVAPAAATPELASQENADS